MLTTFSSGISRALFLFLLSDKKASICPFNSVSEGKRNRCQCLTTRMKTIINALGTTSSMFSGDRLNGSLESESKCALMVDLSMVTFEEGRMTGSRMRVNINGSIPKQISTHDPYDPGLRDLPRYSSGTSPRSSSASIVAFISSTLTTNMRSCSISSSVLSTR